MSSGHYGCWGSGELYAVAGHGRCFDGALHGALAKIWVSGFNQSKAGCKCDPGTHLIEVTFDTHVFVRVMCKLLQLVLYSTTCLT